MRRSLVVVVALAASLCLCSNAGAGVVGVWGETISFNLTTINNFYNSLPGHSSHIITGPLDLTGVDLLWAVQPADDYTSAEIATMASFLAGGGRIAFMGEHGTYAPAQNNRISAALAQLGSGISIVNLAIDGGFHDATVANGQILSHPLTVGVNTYNYACFAPLTMGGASQALMLGIGLGYVMMGYETIGAGSVFVITDQNVWDNVYLPTNDNKVLFENLIGAATGAPPLVTSITPATGLLGASTAVTIGGQNFVDGDTTCTVGGLAVSSLSVVSATSVTGNVSPLLPLGPHTVACTTSDGTGSLPNGFTVLPSPVVNITCADWVAEVGIWGPAMAPCGDLTSTTMTPLYESASFFDVFTDFTYEAELVATRPIQPTAANVIFLRGDPTPRGLNSVWDTGYAFGFTTAATGRKFSIFRYSNGRPIVVQAWVAPVPPAVINGSGVANTLKVEANGGTLTFFLNGTPVKTISGQTLLSGQVGVGMVRSMPTGAAGPKDTLVINAATVTPGGGTRPSKGVSVAQERANEAANRAALTTKPDPLFSDGGRKW